MPSELGKVEVAEVRIELAIRAVLRPLSALRKKATVKTATMVYQ